MTSIKAKLGAVALVLLLIAALAGALWRLAGVSAELSSTTAQVGALERSLEALQARQARLSKDIQHLHNQRIKTDDALRQVLDANKPWADGPVPPAVVDGVCQFANCGR